MDELNTRFPGRSAILDQLSTWLDHTIACAPLMHVFGHSGTGKSTMVQSLLRHTKADATECFRWAYIDTAAALALPKLMFEDILDQLWRHTPSAENLYQHAAKVDSPSQFQIALQEFFGAHPGITACIVLDHADHLAESTALFSAMMALPQLLSPLPLSIITLSHQPWSHFEAIRVTRPPLTLYVPPHSREDVLQLANTQCQREHMHAHLWPAFCAFLFDSLYYGYNRDIAEFLRLADLFFPLYIEPLTHKSNISQARLIRLIQPHIKQYADRLYCRDISAAEWQRTIQHRQSYDFVPEEEGLQKQLALNCKEPSLPRQSMYILLAAYLASYLPANLDGTYFGASRGKGRRRNTQSVAKLSKAAEQRILGPRAFAIDRCLAILYCIWGDEVGQGAEVQKQLTTLISMRLLVCTTSKDNLDAAKCKCMASWPFIHRLAKKVRFDIAQYFD